MAGGERYGLSGWLHERFGVLGDALYDFFACLISIGVSGLAAYFLKQPLLFPSLGPTAFLFFETPLARNASPRSTLLGHLVAILAGAFSLGVFGLFHHPGVLQEGVTLHRIYAAALSVALTGAVLILLRASHPPAGATTLIVSLGLLQTPRDMAELMGGVVLLTITGWIINRLAGVKVPIWSAKE